MNQTAELSTRLLGIEENVLVPTILSLLEQALSISACLSLSHTPSCHALLLLQISIFPFNSQRSFWGFVRHLVCAKSWNHLGCKENCSQPKIWMKKLVELIQNNIREISDFLWRKGSLSIWSKLTEINWNTGKQGRLWLSSHPGGWQDDNDFHQGTRTESHLIVLPD